MVTSAVILDLLLLAVVVATVAFSVRRGFLATLLKFFGTLVALLASWWAAGALSPAVFENFFKNSLISRTSLLLNEGGAASVQAVLDRLAALLPGSLVEGLMEDALAQLQALLNSGAPNIAAQVVERVIAPLFLPIISVVVFFVTFAISGVLVNFLVSALTNLNHMPLLGGMNRALGGVFGLALGLAYALLLLCAVWAVVIITGNGLSWFNTATLDSSRFYQLFSRYNPFF